MELLRAEYACAIGANGGEGVLGASWNSWLFAGYRIPWHMTMGHTKGEFWRGMGVGCEAGMWWG